MSIYCIPFAYAQTSISTYDSTNNINVNRNAQLDNLKKILEIFFGNNTPAININIGKNTSPINLNNSNSQSSFSPNYTPVLSTSVPTANGYTYYQQCGNVPYARNALPDGCTVCNAGCGPSSVAMIVQSLGHVNTDPYAMSLQYARLGQYIGCNGSTLRGAYTALKQYPQLEIKMWSSDCTANNLFYCAWKVLGEPGKRVDEPAGDGDSVGASLKHYTDAGWTILTAANFLKCSRGTCGHFFWITNIDKQNNVWAFDPYFGIGESLPFNENTLYPSPLYRYYLLVRPK